MQRHVRAVGGEPSEEMGGEFRDVGQNGQVTGGDRGHDGCHGLVAEAVALQAHGVRTGDAARVAERLHERRDVTRR